MPTLFGACAFLKRAAPEPFKLVASADGISSVSVWCLQIVFKAWWLQHTHTLSSAGGVLVSALGTGWGLRIADWRETICKD